VGAALLYTFEKDLTVEVGTITPGGLSAASPGKITIARSAGVGYGSFPVPAGSDVTSFDWDSHLTVHLVSSLGGATAPLISRKCRISSVTASEIECRLPRFRVEDLVLSSADDFKLKPLIMVKGKGFALVDGTVTAKQLDTSFFISSSTPTEKLGYGGGTPVEITGKGFLGGIGSFSVSPATPFDKVASPHVSLVPSGDTKLNNSRFTRRLKTYCGLNCKTALKLDVTCFLKGSFV
jgi:hypothetical protein